LNVASHEKQALQDLYVEKAVPIDQFEERQKDLHELCDAWNQFTGRSDTPQDVLHYMRTQRKAGKWVKLGSNHVKREQNLILNAEETEMLVAIVHENRSLLGCGTDELAYDPEIAAALVKEFSLATGRIVPPGDLIAVVTAIRRRGLLPRIDGVRDSGRDSVGFGDIDQAVG
jgi:hypothetical protein